MRIRSISARDRKPDKLPLEANNFGGTFGGPIAKNKLFFFGSFEGYKRTSSITTFFNVPDAALRNGDFSRATNNAGTQQTIYNPFTGNANGTGRTPFDNNQIPVGMINQTALKVMQLYPLPNTLGTGLGGLTRNYQRDETAYHGSRQLRRQDQLEPHYREPDLGQVRLHGCGRR